MFSFTFWIRLVHPGLRESVDPERASVALRSRVMLRCSVIERPETMRFVAEHLMRPISRQYDEAEHENPMEFFNTMWEASRGNRESTKLTGDGKKRMIEIIVKDSQSDTNRAATVTGDLITQDKCDIIVTASTPDTVCPVADQAEALRGSPLWSVTSAIQAEAPLRRQAGCGSRRCASMTVPVFCLQGHTVPR